MQLNISFWVWQSRPGLYLEPDLQPENQCFPPQDDPGSFSRFTTFRRKSDLLVVVFF